MKREFTLAVVALGLCGALRAEVVLVPGRVEVVASARASGPVRFAVQEMTNALSRVLGGAVPVVPEPTEGRVSILLGDGKCTREAGVDVSALPRDGFAVRTVGTNRLVIAGRDGDAPRYFDRPDYRGTPYVEHATSFGVYAFLERFADCRFYFPGELGTILPRADRIVVRDTDWREAPESEVRRYYNHGADGRWFDASVTERHGKALNWARTRMSSQFIPCIHGSIRFNYVERFKDSHPEYFALKEDGGRWFAPTRDRPSNGLGHLCWSSAITNEMFLDAKAYLTGKDASTRGLKQWGRNCEARTYVDIMPNDAMQYCRCRACTAAKLPPPNYANDVVWRATAGIAQRLLDEGVPGYITQMSYNPYKDVPPFQLPSNVLVMVAVSGPFSVHDADGHARQVARTKAWMKKTGRKVWQWTYPGKHGERAFPNVPDICPRAWGRFYREMADYSIGAFAESETDRWFYHHLNYYVFGKVLWDTGTDVDALLDEYYRRMYGAAAADVRALFEQLEDVWVRETMGRTIETDLGPVCAVPSAYELWTRIYTRERIGEWKNLLAGAVGKVVRGSLEFRRLQLVWEEVLRPLDGESAAFRASVSVEPELKRRAAHPEEVSLVVGGDFTTKTRGRWCGKWYANANESFPLAEDATAVGGRCVCLTGRVDRVQVGQCLPDLRPSTRYRLSFFLRLDNLQGQGGKGGAGVTIFDARNCSFPEHTSLTGTMGWRHFKYEFTTHPDTNKEKRSYIRLRLTAGCTGTAWFDGVRLTEISNEENKQ